jgi:hypothetical protein
MSDPQPETPSGGPLTDARDSAVLALARAVERAVRRVDALDAVTGQLAADVSTLAHALDTGPAGAPGAGAEDRGVRSWLLAEGPDQAIADLADLARWMDAVYLRYRDAAVPSCWLWHPEVVEELWWLRCAHADAYHPERGSWLRVGDWHDRQRPGVVRRVTRAVGGCELALHLTDRTHPGRLTGASSHVTPPAPAPLTSAVAQVAAAWAADRAAPEPDVAQLGEADRLSGRRSWR